MTARKVVYGCLLLFFALGANYPATLGPHGLWDRIVLSYKGGSACTFFADEEYWTLALVNDRVVKIEHSPDNGPFWERTRRTLERRWRSVGRNIRSWKWW
jgi:hypothetical protein